MKRRRPRQHKRKLRSGKTIVVNKGVKKRSRKFNSLYDVSLAIEQHKRRMERKSKDDEPITKEDAFNDWLKTRSMKRSRYKDSTGSFKEMTDPDKPWSGKKSKFYGCERSQRAKGKSKESSEKICGYIAARKKGTLRKRSRVLPENVLKVVDKQSGSSNRRVDSLLTAIEPGERVSKNGNVYWETRKNRSDMDPGERL